MPGGRTQHGTPTVSDSCTQEEELTGDVPTLLALCVTMHTYNISSVSLRFDVNIYICILPRFYATVIREDNTRKIIGHVHEQFKKDHSYANQFGSSRVFELTPFRDMCTR